MTDRNDTPAERNSARRSARRVADPEPSDSTSSRTTRRNVLRTTVGAVGAAGAYWVKTAPDGKHAFVPVRGEDEVSVINFEAAEEVARIPVGAQPHVTEHGTIPREIL